MKRIFESYNICFVEVSELLVNDYLDMVNDYENVNRFIGGKQKTYTAETCPDICPGTDIFWIRTVFWPSCAPATDLTQEPSRASSTGC